MEPTIPASAPSNDQVASTQLPKIESPFAALKFAWEMFVKNWQKLAPVAILPTVITYAGTLCFSFGGNIFFAILGIVLMIAGVIFSVASLVAIIKAVERLNSDQTAQITVKEYYKLGFAYFWSIIWVGIISALVGIGGFMLLIVPGIIVSVYVAFYNYALVIDGKKGFSALVESYQLVRGRWLAVFGRAILIGLVCAAISLVINLIVVLFGGKEVPVAVSGLANILTTAIISPLTVLFMYRVFTALKAVRQPDGAAKKFKNVLVGFVCVGILALLSVAIITPMLMKMNIDSIRANADTARRNVEMKSAEIQRLLQEAQTSSVTE